MTSQIDLNRKQERWEIIKALAVLLSATAWAALILAVAHFIK